MHRYHVREIFQEKGRICNGFLRALPRWFGIEAAIQNYVKSVESMPMLVAYQGEKAVGFLSLNLHNEFTAEIHVIAVHPDFHRHGVGRELQAGAEEFLRNKKFEFLTVKTISPSSSNKEYELTRKFYASMGFRPVEEFKTLWGEANPCLLMIKRLHD